MMIYLVVALFAASVGLLVFAVAELIPARTRAVAQRLAELERVGDSPFSTAKRRTRQERRQRLEALLETLGTRIQRGGSDSATRELMTQAGYRTPNAPVMYWGVRAGLALSGAALMLLIAPILGASFAAAAMAALWAAAIGWILPVFHVGRRAKLRKKDMQRALADALDLLVICVEAGLGLNQALVRVAEEISHVSRNMSDELVLTNLEIRAGTPREDALRNLGERTGLEDLRSLIAILIQTDRFGTSVAQALRVQADTLRTKRRQRAEEAAAKTTIKLVFPLVLFIFPAMFVVILGPAMIQIMAALQGLN